MRKKKRRRKREEKALTLRFLAVYLEYQTGGLPCGVYVEHLVRVLLLLWPRGRTRPLLTMLCAAQHSTSPRRDVSQQQETQIRLLMLMLLLLAARLQHAGTLRKRLRYGIRLQVQRAGRKSKNKYCM